MPAAVGQHLSAGIVKREGNAGRVAVSRLGDDERVAVLVEVRWQIVEGAHCDALRTLATKPSTIAGSARRAVPQVRWLASASAHKPRSALNSGPKLRRILNPVLDTMGDRIQKLSGDRSTTVKTARKVVSRPPEPGCPPTGGYNLSFV